jgi:hypothetical protein
MPICTTHDDFTRNATHKLALCWWYSPGTPVSFTAKTGHHDIAEPVVRNPRINKEIVVYSILFLCYLFQAMSKLVQTEWARFQTENNLLFLNDVKDSMTPFGLARPVIISVCRLNGVSHVPGQTWYRHFQRNGGLNPILRC